MTLTTPIVQEFLKNGAYPEKLAGLLGCDPLALEALGLAMIWSICATFEFCFVHAVLHEALRFRQCRSCAEMDDKIERDGDDDQETLAREAYLGTFVGCIMVTLLVDLFGPKTARSVSIYYWANFGALSLFGIIMFGWLPSLSSVYARRSAALIAPKDEQLLIV